MASRSSIHYVVVRKEKRNKNGRRTVFDSRQVNNNPISDDLSNSSVDTLGNYDFDHNDIISEANDDFGESIS